MNESSERMIRIIYRIELKPWVKFLIDTLYIYIQLYNKKREMMVTLFHSFFIINCLFFCVWGEYIV